MKRIFHHPEEPKTGKRLWRGFGEFEDTPEFREAMDREFPLGAQELARSEQEGETTRRQFVKLMGASAALAGLGLSSCRRPQSKILPYSKHVEWVIPGTPLYYATSAVWQGWAMPLVVTTHEGRPTHLTGNTLHEESVGAINEFVQASILNLYDQDRSKGFLKSGKEASQSEFFKDWTALMERVASNAGEGVALLVSDYRGSTQSRLLKEIVAKFPQIKVYRDDVVQSNPRRLAHREIYGDGAVLVPKFDQAWRVLSLDSDFLGLDSQAAKGVGDFMSRRRILSADEKMNRLYVVESRYTVTGGAADHRRTLSAGQIPAVAAALAKALGVELNGLEELASKLPASLKQWVEESAKDLAAHPGESVVVAGAFQSAGVHALVAAINAKLSAFGKTLEVVQGPLSDSGTLAELRQAIEAGEITELIASAESDPFYDAPDDFHWKDVASKLKTYLHLGERVNLSAKKATWHIPGTHYLEAWGDVLSRGGVYSVIQPMIAPLYHGVSELQLLLAILGQFSFEPDSEQSDVALAAVRATFDSLVGSKNDALWKSTVRDGFLKESKFQAIEFSSAPEKLSALLAGTQVEVSSKEAFEITFVPDSKVWDGRFANNGWLQESPDPITKLTWDNAAWVNPKTFRDVLGLKNDGDLIQITLGARKIEIPAMRVPGTAPYTISLPLGYGQSFLGQIAERAGFDVYRLRSSEARWVAQGAKVEALAGKTYTLATTSENYSMKGRAVAREGTQEDWKHNAQFAKHQHIDHHIPPNISIYKGQMGPKSESNPDGFDYENQHQWGMVIDLGSCLGCNACLVACQSENNIPIVGKDQVKMNREMHWIRMDRYFATTDMVGEELNYDELDNPEMLMQPVACQQCESAPCETVCPVNATVHSEEGLNLMTYNRCIGTRYCANNCPYKARRFNFFDYNKRNPIIKHQVGPLEIGNLYAGPLGERWDSEASKLQKNPNVTVRMRGVIEKCTYCIQRLEMAKIKHRRLSKGTANRRMPVDSVKVACQEACSAGAITFGDLSYEESAVSKLKKNDRNYDLLTYVGTRPRTSYLARVKNPNPAITEDAHKVGRASQAVSH